ncbi:MAG TPA: PAS domain S-box protein [Edaphobacter sp.]|nr:PAS domain S-box protein [Edaphobacter sp.]
MSHPHVQDEVLRIETLSQYEALDTTPDSILDEIVSLAARICDAPVAALSLIAGDRIFLKSRFGIESADASLGSLPCETAILSRSLYEIEDACLDPKYGPQGILLDGRFYRLYAGAPVVTLGGVALGALFVLDLLPRTLTPLQTSALTTLSRQITTRLELNNRIRQIARAARYRHRVEAALMDERNFVSAVLDTVGALVMVMDPAGRIVRFNRACEITSGYDFATLVGRYAWDKLHPRHAVPEAIANFERLRSGSFPATFEDEWLHRNGSLRRIAWNVTALHDDNGQMTFIIATGLDVTSERAAETTLRESEARYRLLVEGSLGMVCTHDLRGVLLSVNSNGAATIGRTVADMVGHSLEEFIAPGRRHLLTAYLEQVAETGETQGLLHLSHLDKETRVIAYRNKLIAAPDRAPYVLGFGIDISEQVRVEGRLRALTSQSDSILESIADGIYGVDLDGKVTIVNSAAAQMLGYTQDELLGREMHRLIHHTRADGTPYPGKDCPIRASLSRLNTVRVSGDVFWRKDGTSFPVDYVTKPQIDHTVLDEGAARAIGAVIAFTDTTERHALDRMKDEFISTVSHELRTPLTSVRGALGLLAGETLTSRPEKTQQMLDIAISNSDRLIRLVNDILDLERIGSGKAEFQPILCDMADLLHRAATLQQTLTPKTEVRITLAAGTVNVWADPDRILQALNNLISNAIKFSYPGGKIHLAARNLDENEAIVEIVDQGRGVPADKLEKIFDRFQQVDASDSRDLGGTGLGLAICRSIITQNGGRIWASSNADRGMTFHFTLPTKPARHLR